MLRMHSSALPGRPNDIIYYDLKLEEARLLFSVKSFIQRFINNDEYFHVVVGNLNVFTGASPLINSIKQLVVVTGDHTTLRWSRSGALQLLRYEPLFNNHVSMINTRQIHGRFMCKCACLSIVRVVDRENISYSPYGF
jgi:hypothetical protein